MTPIVRIAGICLLAVAAAASRGAAQVTPPSAAPSSVATAVTEFDAGGLKVLVKRRESSQTVVAALFVKGGVRNVTSQNAGIESLMFDVATEASAAFSRARMRRELARTGSSLSFGASRDYSLMTLASPKRHFDATWTLFVDATLRPAFAADDFERTRTRHLNALMNMQDTPEAFIAVLQAQAAFAGHPYLNDPEGTPASIATITRDDLQRYHRRVMTTSRLLLIVVGNVDVADVRRKATAAFGSLPRGDYRDTPLPPLRFETPSLAVTERALPTNYVSGMYPAPPPGSADFYAMRVATTILRDRVFEEVRTKRNLSYAPDAFLSSQAVNTGGLSFTSVDANQTARLMLDEIRRLQQEDVPASLIRSTGQGFLTSSFLDQETNSAQAGVLALHEIVAGGWRQAGQVLDRVRAVTPADVRRVANTYMRNLQFVALGDPRRFDRQAFTSTP